MLMMTEGGDIRDPHARRAVSLMDRADLEDRHLKTMEENLLLKKHARSQEEKMKKMATKLLRLTADEKKEAKRDGQSLGAVQLRQWDIEVREVVEELQGRIRELEKHNTTLKNKVLVLRQQSEIKRPRHTPYGYVQPRISTGLGKKGQKSFSTEDVSMRRHNAGSQSAAAALPRYGHSLLEDARRDNLELEELVLQLKQEVAVLTAEIERDKEQFKLQALQHEEDKLKLQEQLQVQLTAVQKSSIHEDVELIKLQRELREKSIRLQSLQSQYLTLEKNLEVMKASHAKVLQEMEVLNTQLGEEQNRSSQLQSEVRGAVVSQRALSELQEMVTDLREEKELLKQTNERLMRSALEADKDMEHRAQVKVLQDRIKQLETRTKENLSEKAKIFDKLSSERELSEKLDRQLREVRDSYCQLKEEHQQLKERMKFISKESSVDWGEVEEALVLVKEGRGKGRESKRGVEPLPFLEKVEEEDKVDYHRELQELRSSHADTISELEKTRKLLALQHTINKDYKKEVDSLKSQLGRQQCEYEGRLQEYAQLLDIKAAHVKKLEGQLRNIAYGTRQYKIDTSKFEYGSGRDLEESIELERGQNLLQFHVTQVILSSEALSHLNTSSPAVFLTFNFFDFETQVTPVVQGARPLFNFTSNFVVTMDDTFLHHLQKGFVHVEIHQAFGMRYHKLAAGSVRCRELLSSAGGRVHGKVVLTGVDSMQQCMNVGSMDYWMRFKLPMTQAVRLYQERNKVLSLIDQTVLPKDTKTAAAAVSHPHGPDYNELAITITRCSGLKARDPAYSPSPYVMYKFYSFPDHDTEIIPHSPSPAFKNTKHFPVSVDQHLDSYLRTEHLEVYVFDDLDSMETNYLGVAQVSLLPLAKGEHIRGKFQLATSSGDPAGFVQLSLKWKLPYHTWSTSPPLSPSSSPPPPHQKPKKNSEQVDFTEIEKTEDMNSQQPLEERRTISKKKREEHVHTSTVPSPTVMVSPSTSVQAVAAEEKVSSSGAQVGPRLTGPPKKLANLESLAAVVEKAPEGGGELFSEEADSNQPAVEPTMLISDHETESLVEESSDSTPSGLPLDSDEVVANGVVKRPVEKLLKVSPGKVRSRQSEVKVPHPLEVGGGGGGEEFDTGDSVSVTVTEWSEEEEEEEIEEDLSQEDTMFEETLINTAVDDELSALSEHSSDEQGPPPPIPTQPNVIVVEGKEGGGGESLTPSEAEYGNPVTPVISPTVNRPPSPRTDADTISITISSIEVKSGSSLAEDSTIVQLFVEYQFLNFNYGDLETISVAKPPPGQSAVFDLKTVFRLDSLQKDLLLKPPSRGRVVLTVVSDPDDQQYDCIEVGTVEIDLNTIVQRRKDLVDEKIELLSLESDDDPEVLGYLTVSVEAWDVLQQLVTR